VRLNALVSTHRRDGLLRQVRNSLDGETFWRQTVSNSPGNMSGTGVCECSADSRKPEGLPQQGMEHSLCPERRDEDA
jgi:hypothetical protein